MTRRPGVRAWIASDPGRFHAALGLALLSRVGIDALRGNWQVHAGQLFAYRHLPIFPLWSPLGLALEWAALGVAAVALLVGAGLRRAVWLALLATLASLSQRFSNAQALQLIVLAFLALDPEPVAARTFLGRPPVALLRWQLIVVYGFSGCNKLLSDFVDGSVVQSLLAERGLAVSAGVGEGLAWLVIAVELALPPCLLRAPRAGVALAIALHASLALAMPGVLPFGLLALALALLFLPARRPQANATLDTTPLDTTPLSS